MPIIQEGMGFIKSKKLKKAKRGLKRGIINRKTVSLGARGGAAFFTGGQSEVYRRQSRAVTGGDVSQFVPNFTEGLNGIESLGENALEGMGRRGFRPRAIVRRAASAAKKVAKKSVTVAKATTKLASAQSLISKASGGVLDADSLKEIGAGLTDFGKGFISKKGGGGGAQESEGPAERVMASSRGGVFSWGQDGGGGGGGGSMFSEQVEETNPETGKKEVVTKMKPTIKYGLIGLGGLAAIILFYKMKRK